MNNLQEPTRRLPDPDVDQHGNLIGRSVLTPTAMKTRGALAVPPARVIPVIVVPGIMGSNLCASADGSNRALDPGEPAWRPPNGAVAGLSEASRWKDRRPQLRQQILDPDTLDVDDSGEIDLSGDLFGMHAELMRKRGWGEVHWSSYGRLLYTLQRNLNHTFDYSLYERRRFIQPHWRDVIESDRAHWDAANMAALTEAELERYARFQYPVYACGYNWVQSNEQSARRLEQRILDVIGFWSQRKHACEQVIVVTHSMGGLVARACAKRIPDKIAGIVHGVMPALGAPLCYRRIACGTETSTPGGSWVHNLEMGKFADIAGRTPEETTPAMATAPGPLELLPNHLYPGPWLHVSRPKSGGGLADVLSLPQGSPYDLYRDMQSWYRLINPELADPAKKYEKEPGGVAGKIADSLSQPEKFHTQALDTYYHPNTYAYYGADEAYPSFGAFRWVAAGQPIASLDPETVRRAKGMSHTFEGGRNVMVEKSASHPGGSMYFEPSAQDAPGDGTVPHQSGAGPRGKAQRVFRTRGYDHQGSYGNDHMLKLTQHLIVKIAQGVK